eukprot:953621-Prorocentrum_minimum.AAC.2
MDLSTDYRCEAGVAQRVLRRVLRGVERKKCGTEVEVDATTKGAFGLPTGGKGVRVGAGPHSGVIIREHPNCFTNPPSTSACDARDRD